MENANMRGIFFNEADIRDIVERHLDWAEIVDGQIYCADKVMSDDTPIGTSIIVGCDGIKCEDGSDELKLIMSSGIYELCVKTTHANDEINIRFDKTVPIPGTYGQFADGVLDILTEEEKNFKGFVSDALEGRDDEYAQAFMADNVRNIGGRGLILLEKIKAEIKNDDILSGSGVTPIELVAVFIEKTASYIDASKSVEELSVKHDELLAEYRDTYDEGSKGTKKLARDIEVINKKIAAASQIGNFCKDVIDAAVMPIFELNIGR